MASMSAMVEQVYQRAGQDQQERQEAEEVRPMFRQEEEQGHGEEHSKGDLAARWMFYCRALRSLPTIMVIHGLRLSRIDRVENALPPRPIRDAAHAMAAGHASSTRASSTVHQAHPYWNGTATANAAISKPQAHFAPRMPDEVEPASFMRILPGGSPLYLIALRVVRSVGRKLCVDAGSPLDVHQAASRSGIQITKL